MPSSWILSEEKDGRKSVDLGIESLIKEPPETSSFIHLLRLSCFCDRLIGCCMVIVVNSLSAFLIFVLLCLSCWHFQYRSHSKSK